MIALLASSLFCIPLVGLTSMDADQYMSQHDRRNWHERRLRQRHDILSLVTHLYLKLKGSR